MPERRLQQAGTVLLFALSLALAGCGEEKRQPAKGTAGGEVLEASVSDAMLPVDQVRSQPPLAPRTEAAKGTRRESSEGEGEEAAAAEEAGADQPASAGEAPPEPPKPVEE